MTRCSSPPPPFPKPLAGSETGSFAHDTIIRRFPKMLRQTLAENDFPPGTQARLLDLLADIPSAPVRILEDPQAPDEQLWSQYLQPYLGQDWLQIPWFLAEAYFFRRMLEATGYFQPGPGYHQDPYQIQKIQGMEQIQERITAAARQLEAWQADGTPAVQYIQDMLLLTLWGNQADLSLWPVGGELRPDHRQQAEQEAHLLVDDRQEAAKHLCAQQPQGNLKRVDFIIDNAGLELTMDLCLADLLLTTRAAETVRFHLKYHPTFISDALVQDVTAAISSLGQAQDEPVHRLGRRLQANVDSHRLELVAHLYWNSPLPAWEMPLDLRSELSTAHLVISKGDMNYRRLVGDRRWNLTTPFPDIVCYYPSPLLAVRVLKSDVCVGLQNNQIARLEAQEPGWMTSGHWGVIQFTERIE
jgi:uncharacterized protein with ATP-grasp and redox domains